MTAGNNHRPPRLPDRFLQWFCADEVLETLQGDLYELYEKRRTKNGKLLADMCYWADVASACRPFAFGKNKSINSGTFGMYCNYLKIAWRRLINNKAYSAINISGLSLGLAIAGVTAIYIHHELSYDDFHREANSIYCISGKQSGTWFAFLSAPYSNYINDSRFPEVEKMARVRRWPARYLKHGSERFYERKVLFTDPGTDFFQLFDFEPVQGQLTSALRDPNSAVITESVASLIYGGENAVGQPLIFDTLQLKVTAVIKDLPSNSNFDFKVLIANSRAMSQASGHFTYCLLAPDADTRALSAKIMAADTPEREFSRLEECRLIPLKELHFEGDFTYEMKQAGNKTYLLLFALIGLAILLLSFFNFVNLSVAQYARRAKEVAIRKVAGASRSQLSSQFLVESLCLTLLGFPLILVLIELMLPLFNSMVGLGLANYYARTPAGFFTLLGITAAAGLAAGFYPAMILPRISSLSLFKSQKMAGVGSLNLRTLLVALQVTVMTVMLSGSWILHSQMGYMESKDLGFEKTGVIKLKGAWLVDSLQYTRIKAKLLESPSIISVSQGFAPGDEDYGYPFKKEGSDIVYNDLIAFGTDADYLKALGLDLLRLQHGYSMDPSARLVLVNETLAERLGFDDAVGERLVLSPGRKHETVKTINGVFRDFHFFSLHQGVSPMLLTIRPFGSGISDNILVKVRLEKLPETLNYINSIAEAYAPDVPLASEFLDESLARMYEKERMLSTFSSVLLLVTVFLSALGLAGLSSYLAEMKTKEIGIRKVLGAGVRSILQLVSAPFFKMALISFVPGSLASLYLMNRWLENFAYHISISWLFYLYTLVALLVVVLVTVGGHALRAAQANPVNSLRSE